MSNVVNIDWFRQELKKKNLSQKELGEALDVTGQTITFTFKGGRVFRADEVAKIAEILDTPAVFVLAASTQEFDLEKEIEREAETLSFACTKADEMIARARKSFSEKRRLQLIALIYKIARRHQAKGGETKELDLDSIELALSSLSAR